MFHERRFSANKRLHEEKLMLAIQRREKEDGWEGFMAGVATGVPLPFNTGSVIGSSLHHSHRSSSDSSSSSSSSSDWSSSSSSDSSSGSSSTD